MKKSFVFFLISLPSLLFANSNSDSKYFADMGDKFLICSTFYKIGSGCVSDTHPDISDVLDNSSELYLGSAVNFYKKTNTDVDAIAAKYDLMRKSLLNEMKNHCQNISILTLKYGQNCKNLIDK